MGVGWNLGNALDTANKSETYWGNPKTTEAMIDAIYKLGFNTIRIPVSWSYHCDDDYNIDESWLERVQEIVDWALENDMYVIIDSHHDNDVYYPSEENHDQAVEYITKIWTQVAEYFKDYDEHLIFEVMNEPRLEDTSYEWNYVSSNSMCQAAMETIMDCNQAFVNVVRNSGGNNATRYLMASTYCGGASSALNSDFKMPTDKAGHTLLSVHAYTPYNLCQNPDMSYTTFDNTTKSEIYSLMQQLYTKFVKNGTYVCITEFGCINKDNPDDRYNWAKYFVSTAKDFDIACVVWDNNYCDTGEETFGIFNRKTLKVYDDALQYYKGLIAGIK